MLRLKNIVLRAPEPRDVDFLYHLENDEKLWHVSQTLRPFSRFEMEQYVLMSEKDPFEAHQVRFMIDLTSDETIGTIDLFDIDSHNKRAGVGIVVVDKYRNKGYAFLALELLKEYCFNHLNLHQLFCNIESSNTLSLTLFKKTGFTIVGLKKDWNIAPGKGVWADEYFLQLINE
ncbi:MAG: GNAT family N-acetyltransferase [Bacteroidetes bacterium]|nr:MAG: GNAT family N-acetyltransferase [Bacteroidota bacterium]